MLKNYLKTALRTLRRQPGFTAINMAGLAIGLTCCILIGLFVHYEWSFDRFHNQAPQIYRLNKTVTPQEGGEERHAITAGLMGPAIETAYPEVKQSLRVLPWFDDVMLEYEQSYHRVSDFVFADANFFSMFDFKLLQGNPESALKEPRSIVLTEAIAQRIFGAVDPMGQSIIGLNDLEYTVTGIAATPPMQSHLQFNVLVSWSTTGPGESNLNFAWLNRWITQVNYTYLELAPGTDPALLEAKFPALLEQNLPERANQYHLYLQPLLDIYLHSDDILYVRGLRLGNASTVRFFSIVGFVILLIACINFVNLATAQGTRRAREVGVRKVMGAHRSQLKRQFLTESVIMTFASLAVAVVIVWMVLPAFNNFIGRQLTFNVFNRPVFLLAIAGLTLLTSFGAGSYPALSLSRFLPVEALRQHRHAEAGRVTPRKMLVILQYVASVVLIVGTVVVYEQMSFMRTSSPGFEREHVMVMNVGDTEINGQYEAFKQEIMQHPGILHATGSNSVPGSRAEMSSYSLRPEGKPEDETWEAITWRLDDFDLVDTYNLEMATGRFFSPDFSTDSSSSVVINETLAKALGWAEPIGKRLDIPGEIEEARVIGVLKDFHFESLHHEISPLILYVAPRYENISVRFAGDQIGSVLSFLERTWQQFESVYPFTYSFLEESSARYYETEVRLMKTVGFFALLAVFIASLGLLGLAAFSVQKRTKEIGIRKLLGASLVQLTGLLSGDFMKLVMIAILIAVPIGYLVMTHWLEGFAYRINLGPSAFVLAGLMALIIASFTIGLQTIRAARANPIEALRYE